MKKINDYLLYEKEPNTIHPKGRVYVKTFFFNTNNRFKKRLVRVYLPSTYDFNNPEKRFSVLYMLDGKNLFDDYTSFVGEWGIDEIIESQIEKGLDEGRIVVGIDAPKTNIARTLEMTPKGIEPSIKGYDTNSGYAELLGEFIFNDVKNDIDKTFYTKTDKEHTGVGGSSMGGLMAFYLGRTYPHKVSYALCFSPAFFLFQWESFQKMLEEFYVGGPIPKYYFYVGGVGFEGEFVKATEDTYKYFKSLGYDDKTVKYVYDPTQEHNEKAWNKHFLDAYLFSK